MQQVQGLQSSTQDKHHKETWAIQMASALKSCTSAESLWNVIIRTNFKVYTFLFRK